MTTRACYVWNMLIGCAAVVLIGGLIVLGVSVENGHAAAADIAASQVQQARYSACATLAPADRAACVNPPQPAPIDNADPTGKVRACIDGNGNGSGDQVTCIRGVIGEP